jgi:hypothetical protein
MSGYTPRTVLSPFLPMGKRGDEKKKRGRKGLSLS